jgi:hypothetical protein
MNVTSATNHRTAICTILPDASTDYSVRLVMPTKQDASHLACLTGLFNSFAFDYLARQKLQGLNFSDYITYQLAVPKKDALLRNRSLIVPRVLELNYAAWDLEPFAQDCEYDGPPFRWDEQRRFQLRCELDAGFFHLYLGSDEEWRQQPESLTKYFSTPRDAVAYMMDTFPIVKRKDEEKFGAYRTKDTILKIYDELPECQRTGRPYVSPLNPPPGPPTDEHGHFIPMSQWDPNHWPSHIHPPRDKGELKAKVIDG